MEGNTQVNYTICQNTLNNNNLTRHEKTIHNPLITGTIEYHSTADVANLKNEIVQSDNEKVVHKPSVTFSSDIKKMYKCSDCTYSTKRSTDLRRHEKAIHKPSVKNMYECRYCTYSTHWSFNLRRHQNDIHKQSVKKMYKCQDCTYSTNQPHNLRRHERAIHKPSFKHMYECRDCAYSSNRSFNLRRHQNDMHKPLVTEKIEYHSTIDVSALKNKILNQYHMKLELGREIKKIVQKLNAPLSSLNEEYMTALELFENHEQIK